MDKKKIDFRKLLDNSSFLLIASIICAVLIWYGVVSQDRNAEATVRNVPVNVDVENSALQSLNLSPVNDAQYTVDVEIEGFRTVVGSVEPEDLRVEARLSNVTAPGTYELSLEGFDSKNRGVVIKGTVPRTISMRFDHMIEKTLPVEAELNNLKITEGYILNQDYVTPSQIVVRGPETEMESIKSAKAIKDFDSEISQTVSFDVPIVLENAQGEEVVVENVDSSEVNATITLPILRKKVVPVTIDFIGAPLGFNTDTLEFHISPSEIELAGPVSTINSLSELHLGYIDIRSLEPETYLTYSAQLPPGYISVDNTQNIDVDFMGNGIEEKLINVTDIRTINKPSNYSILVQTKTFYGVKVFGPKDQIAKVTGQNIVAQIDMADVDLKAGTVTAPVNFVIPQCDGCWVYGSDYKAVITIKEK